MRKILVILFSFIFVDLSFSNDDFDNFLFLSYLNIINNTQNDFSEKLFFPISENQSEIVRFYNNPFIINNKIVEDVEEYFIKSIDIKAEKNTPVSAIKEGRVIERTYSPLNLGFIITVLHENNIISVYCHLNNCYKKVGDNIKEGEILGSVGYTGFAFEPVLKLILIINGKYADPIKYF
jgi:murein DD-endopeptidase MepM/ murein hydrolase activator NlpD